MEGGNQKGILKQSSLWILMVLQLNRRCVIFWKKQARKGEERKVILAFVSLMCIFNAIGFLFNSLSSLSSSFALPLSNNFFISFLCNVKTVRNNLYRVYCIKHKQLYSYSEYKIKAFPWIIEYFYSITWLSCLATL